ncbi:MAG: sugar ABC transporter ATP-binding protein [Planctomycetota bacterium]|jgi:ribose transport system ATP-binding protein
MAEVVVKMPQPTAPRLEMRGVSKRFGATVALANVDLTVHPGEVHALVGENGAGKSTLMKILSGAHRPDKGSMLLDGEPYRPRNPIDGRRTGVGMIYQELSLAPHLTVEENILLGMEPTRYGFVRRDEVRARAGEAISRFDHPDIRPDAKVSSLSVGAQQLVEIGRALAVGCRVLVLDEPTSSLNQADTEKLFGIIGQLRDQGQSIIYISHFIEEVKRVADRVTVLRDGEVVGTRDVAGVEVGEIVAMMVGREVSDLYPRSARKRGEAVLEIGDLAGETRPQSASFALHRGEVLGIAGLVGAGRTEMLRCIFGLDPVRSGRIRLGAYVGPASPVRRWAQGAGLLSEDRKEEGLAVALSVADNVTLSRLEGFGPLGLVLPGRQDEAVMRWIDRLGIRCRSPRQPVVDLSGGNQQKVAVARMLQHDVDVMLLDEPTRGVDVAAKATIYRLIDELACGSAEEGREPKAILVVSSYLPELMGICDRVAVMCRGRLGPARETAEIDEHQLMTEATGQELCA